MGRWRGPAANDVPYMTMTEIPPQPLPLPVRPPSPRMVPTDSKHELFELFTSTDLRILRATPACYPLTGYHPHEYVNISLLEWIHPADRHFLDLERNRLINVPFVAGPLQSNRETQAAITQLSERELLSPAEGMREPYPNQNVRVLRSDNSFDWFNVRLHLGGGLGASLWRANTLGKVYVVVSLLFLRPPPELIHDDPSRRPVPMLPPIPVAPIPAMPSQQALPSFSSFAAAAEAPRQRHDPPPPTQPTYYPPQPAARPQPPSPQPQQYSYSRPTAPPYARRSLSPTHRPPPATATSYPEYPPQPPQPYHPPPPQQQPYYPEMAQRPPPDAYRRPSGGTDDYARSREGALPPGDYGRRAWEL